MLSGRLRICSVLLLALACLGWSAAHGVSGDVGPGQVFIDIAPEEQFRRPIAEVVPLLDGEVVFYRDGSVDPSFVRPLHTVVDIPAGRWWWRAEAPGWTTIDAGFVSVNPAGEASCPRQLWPAVPACHIQLVPGALDGLARIDVISLDRPATTPLVRGRNSAWVPAGRLVAYSVGTHGLRAVSAVASCRQGEIVELDAPDQPGHDENDIMAHFDVPEEAGRAADLVVTLEAGGVMPVSPLATVAFGSRVTTFFRRARSSAPYEVVARHPNLRTHTLRLVGRGAEAIELAPVRLRPRVTLVVRALYHPAGTPRPAQLSLMRCDASFLDPKDIVLLRLQACEPLEETGLAVGISEARFDGLDVGMYVPVAVVGDEVIPGAGEHAWLDVTATSAATEEWDLVLREQVVEGRILRGGEPVAGAVRLRPANGMGPSERVFPADGDSGFRIRYVERMFPEYFRQFLPQQLASLPPAELRGLSGNAEQLEVCDAIGFCDRWTQSSWIFGSNAVDFELANGPRVKLRILDRASLQPVASARVAVQDASSGPRYVYQDGVISSPSARPIFYSVDASGVASFRALSQSTKIAVGGAGYNRVELALAPDQPLQFFEVELERTEPARHLPARLLLPDGRPAGGAVILFADPEAGSIDPVCSTRADGLGAWKLADVCETRDLVAVVVHPQAALDLTSRRELMSVAEVQLSPKDRGAGEIRLIREGGAPLAGALIDIEIAGLRLDGGLLLLMQLSGGRIPYRTGPNGEVPLVDLGSGRARVDAVRLGWKGERISMPVPAPGEIVEVLVP